MSPLSEFQSRQGNAFLGMAGRFGSPFHMACYADHGHTPQKGLHVVACKTGVDLNRGYDLKIDFGYQIASYSSPL